MRGDYRVGGRATDHATGSSTEFWRQTAPSPILSYVAVGLDLIARFDFVSELGNPDGAAVFRRLRKVPDCVDRGYFVG